MRVFIAVPLALAVIVGGCATKRYGRLQPLSGVEMAEYDCKAIALEISKVDAFDMQVREQGGFNGASALGVLGDFGLGNSMERGQAEKSSIARRQQLQMLSAQKNCAMPQP